MNFFSVGFAAVLSFTVGPPRTASASLPQHGLPAQIRQRRNENASSRRVRAPSPRAAGRSKRNSFSRRAPRPRFANNQASPFSPRNKPRGAERRNAHPTNVRATPVSVTACRCAGAEARQYGARSPSGAPLRHLPRLLPLGSAPGRASWNYRVQTGGPSPAPVQRAPRGPVIVQGCIRFGDGCQERMSLGQ